MRYISKCSDWCKWNCLFVKKPQCNISHKSLIPDAYTYLLFLHLLPQSISLKLPSMASMAATASSSTTVVRATPFLGQTKGSNANTLRDSVSMVNGKFTMVNLSLLQHLCKFTAAVNMFINEKLAPKVTEY